MKNHIELRGHHLLCLPGYKGKAYNKQSANSWSRVSESLKNYPNMLIKIVTKEDTLCKSCPNTPGSNHSCNAPRLTLLDKKVIELIGVIENSIYKYDEIQKKLFTIMTPEKHENICGKCHWRGHGLCKDTFKKVD